MSKSRTGFLILWLMLFALLPACNRSSTTLPESLSGGFWFDIDPAKQSARLELPIPTGLTLSTVTPPGETRLLTNDELELINYSYEFVSGNRMILEAEFKNATTDFNFERPFFFTVNEETSNILSSNEPELSDQDLGGDGVLSPDETTATLTFEVFHKGQPFTYYVDGNAAVTDANPDPLPTEDDIKGISADPQVGLAPLPVTFSATFGDEDATYAWDFGDGSTGSGATAEHTYSQAGNYTATLTVTSDGETETFTTTIGVLPNLDEPEDSNSDTVSPEWLNLKDTSTLEVDLGDPVPGWEYRWDFGDGSTGEGSRISHTYPALGMYELRLTIVDTGSSGGNLKTQQLSEDTTLFDETYLPNVWRPAPEARFSFTGDSGSGVPIGTAPFDLTFNAGGSSGSSDLSYLWDFGDGTTSTDVAPSHSFAEGEYVVTLTVSDRWDQTDQYRAYIVSRNENFFGQLRINYPIQPEALRLSAVDEIDTLMQQAVAAYSKAKTEGFNKTTPTHPQALAELVTPNSADGTRYESTFPYVVHNSALLERAIFRWTPWDNGNNGPYVFCEDNRPAFGNEGIHVFYNGLEWVPTPPGLSPPVFLFRANFDTLYDFCFMTQLYSSGNGYGVQARSENTVDITAVRHDLRYSFDSFAGLRVPKVHVSVLPDQMVPGNFASPYVTETSIPGNDGDELALIVRIRESEAGSFVNFKLPVYAVDQSNNQVNATGYFKAELEGITSDCGDCIMVDGKAYINVSLPVSSANYYDLTKFKLYATPSCNFDSAWNDTTFGSLRGCTNVTATHEMPGGTADIEPFPYPLSSAALAEFDTVAIGSTRVERKAIQDNLANTSVNAVKLVVSLIPIIGDGIDLSLQAVNSLRGEEVDFVLVILATGGLALDLSTGGVADITAPIKAVYKLSLKSSTKLVAEILQDTLKGLVNSGKTAREVIDNLKLNFGILGDLFRAGPDSVKRFEELVDDAAALGCPLSRGGLETLASTKECRKDFFDKLTQARKRLLDKGVDIDINKVTKQVDVVKQGETGGYEDLLGLFNNVNDKGQYEGYIYQLEYTAKNQGNQAVKPRWAEANREYAASYTKYTDAGYPPLDNGADADLLSEVLLNPGGQLSYLDGKRWVADQVKAGGFAALNSPGTKAQAQRLGAWAAEEPGERIARFVVGRPEEITGPLWDQYKDFGVVFVDFDGRLVARP